MDTLKKYKTAIIGATAVTVAAVVGYLVYKSSTSDEKETKDEGKRDEKPASKASHHEEEHKGDVRIEDETHAHESTGKSDIMDMLGLTGKPAGELKVERDSSGYLTKSTIVSLLRAILEESKKSIATMSENNRNERRRVLHNRMEYLQIYGGFMEEFNATIAEITEKICKENNITNDDYMDSFEYLVKNGHQDILMLQSAVAQLMKGAIKSSKHLSPDDVKDAVAYQAELMANEMRECFQLPQVQMMMYSMPEMAFGLVQSRVADLVHEKFGYEEEDILQSIQSNNMQDDPDLKEIFQQLMSSMMSMMPGDPMGGMGGGPGGPGGPGMMMPGMM